MFDRGRFWSPVPDWCQVAIKGTDISIQPVLLDASLHLVSGAFGGFLARHGLARCLGPADNCGATSYALRLAPDRLLLVGVNARSDMVPGWTDGVAISDVSDGYVVIDVIGPGAEALMRRGAAYDFGAGTVAAVESATMLFAGLKAAVSRCPGGWRLHIERPQATALWHWLEKAC